jgi:hypothetical protein
MGRWFWQKLGRISLFWGVFLCLWLVGDAAIASPDRVALTLEILQNRIDHPVTIDGMTTIDLRQLIIEFKPETNELTSQFNSLLQNRLNRSTQPVGIDLSDSLIKGDFDLSPLGLPTRLSKESLPQILTPEERQQLERDLDFLLEGGQQAPSIKVFRGALTLHNTIFTGQTSFSRTFFLRPVEAIATQFWQGSLWSQTRFGRQADFSQAVFKQNADFSQSTFFGIGKYSQADFRGEALFKEVTFKDLGLFEQAQFHQLANFSRLLGFNPMNFKQVDWRDRVLFSKSRFFDTLSLVGATFEKSGSFRSNRFSKAVTLQDVKLLGQLDFSDAIFFPYASLNLAGLGFDSEQAKILGETGVIGNAFTLPKLEGNEAVVRNLVRNFRDLEQIPDANAIEYRAKTLELAQLARNFLQFPLKISLSQWLTTVFKWLVLSFLLLFCNYGTNLSLIWGIGVVAIAYFGALFWLIDRWRKRTPVRIMPNRYDTICVLATFFGLTTIGLINILQASDYPVFTLLYLGLILFPIPLALMARLYIQGRFHDDMDSSYFVLDGSLREFRLLLIRFPVVPEFPLFRDRYTLLVWTRGWNWLNYFDYSCNNLLKIGFNDIRLRDYHLPGIVAALSWYQWGIGLIYITLLLWTLSRTIPGLNLLIYLK